MGITDTLTERILRAEVEELKEACLIRDDTLDDRERRIEELEATLRQEHIYFEDAVRAETKTLRAERDRLREALRRIAGPLSSACLRYGRLSARPFPTLHPGQALTTSAPADCRGRARIRQLRRMEETMSYHLEGRLLEVCNCRVLCPCWIGEDPDGGSCDAFNAYHFDEGTIRGIEVGGLSIVHVVHIPGNVLTPGSWRVVQLVDERATDEQLQAIVDAYQCKLGGPLADVAALFGEIVAVERAPIEHRTVDGKGTLAVGDVLRESGLEIVATTIAGDVRVFSAANGRQRWRSSGNGGGGVAGSICLGASTELAIETMRADLQGRVWMLLSERGLRPVLLRQLIGSASAGAVARPGWPAHCAERM